MNARPFRLLALFAASWVLVAAASSPPAGGPGGPPVVADAAMRGELSKVRTLITQGLDVNEPQGDGMTALHWAADRGDSLMAIALVGAKANLHARTRVGAYTPLHIAARAGNAGVIRALLRVASPADVKATTASGATALHFAAAAGNADIIKALVGKGADPNARESMWGQTPLVFAAEYNRAAAIKQLLQSRADPSIHTRVVNISDQTAREQAATKRRNDVLITLEPPARHDSAEAEFKAAVAAARAAARANGGGGAGAGGGGGAGAGGGGGRAARGGGAAGDDSTGGQNAQAQGGFGGGRGGPTREPRGPFTSEQIQAAIDSGRVVLLAPAAPKDSAKEEVDTANGGVQGYIKQVGSIGGLTALHHAVRQGNVDAVIALLDGGANINDTSYVDRTTPLVLALINGQFDVAKQLIERGADPNIATTSGMLPLYAVINTQWAPRSRYPQPQSIQTQKTPYLELAQALIKKGADVNAKLKRQPWYFSYNNCGNANCGLENIDGTTPFWRAAYALDIDAMKLLVASGADPNVPSAPPPPGRGGRGGRGGGAPTTDSGTVAAAGGPSATPGTPAKPAAAGGNAGANAGANAAASAAGPAAQPNIPGFSGPAVRLDPEIEALARVAPVGTGVLPIHAAAGVGYGNGFAGNSHRHAPEGWMPALRYLVEVLHADVNARDNNGYTPLHHAAARGDNEMIMYLVAHGADVKAVSRNGRTVVDMANGPVQRLRPFPETIALLEKLGAKNQHHCVSC
jgi:uncharacterized protein